MKAIIPIFKRNVYSQVVSIPYDRRNVFENSRFDWLPSQFKTIPNPSEALMASDWPQFL